MKAKNSYWIKDWIKDLQKQGRITFSRNEVEDSFPALTEPATRNALNRLVTKGEVVSVWKGFYVIVPLKYASRKIVPPVLYIDDLMKYLDRLYYVGLLNAAAFYGAAHQQPQDFFVLSTPPALRDTTKKGVRINFVSRKDIPPSLLQSFKTETGYVQVSSPELTAADLITYQTEVGGLNRTSTVLNDLAESLHIDSLNGIFFENVSVSTVQRLGFLLEKVLEQTKPANNLLAKAKENGCIFQKIPLKYGNQTEGCEVDSKWKIIINEEIEIDE
jgi:predicted transcriptional regulator of viral defense system